MKISNGLIRIFVVLIALIPVGLIHAGVVRTWVGTAGNNLIQDTNNWSPLVATQPSSSAGDILQWDGSAGANLMITNGIPTTGGSFDSSPGFFIRVTAGQNGLTFSQSNGAAGRIRLGSTASGTTGTTNTLFVAAGAGPVTFGDGGTVDLILAPAGSGGIHPFTNNSLNTVTFKKNISWITGGGGNHTLIFGGSGNWQFDTKVRAATSGGGNTISLTVSGPGSLNLVGNSPNTAPAGGAGNVTVNGGTLQFGGAGALESGPTLVINGGSLDSSVPNLVLSPGLNVQTWGGDFAFVGTQSLNLGAGAVTMAANRNVTVSANTLEVDGTVSGAGRLTKSGAGTLFLSSTMSYTGGTVVSNGVLRLNSFPSGTSAAENLSTFGNGKLDVNGNSFTISALNGSGGSVDTAVGGAPTLTVGDFNANGSFSGAIQNTAGSMALIKTGTGSLTLGGASTFSGGTTVSAGVLLVTNTAGSGTGSGAVAVNSGATFGGSGIVGGSVTWQSGSSATFIQGSPLTVSGSVALNGNAITVNIPGATPLGSGNYTLMTYNNSGSSGSFATSVPTFTGAGVSAGSSIAITNGNGLVSLIVASPPGLLGVWTNNGNGNWSVPANWSSNPQVPKNAGEVSSLGLGSAFTAVTLDIPVTNGFVSFGNTNSFAIANAGNTLTFDNTNGGAALIVINGSSNSIAAPVSLNDNLAISTFSGASMAISNVISSTSPGYNLTIGSGAGTLLLYGNNTYGPSAGSVGTTILGGGTLELDNNNALSAGDVSIFNSSTIRAGIALTVPNNIIISNTVTSTINNNGNDVTLSGVISGGGALGKNGAGTLTLSGANSYNGDTSINAGTVKLVNASGIPGGTGNGNVNLSTNTLLDLNGLSPVLNGLNASATAAGATVDSLSGGAVTLTLGEGGSFATFYGNIKNTSGSLALVKDGTGNQTLAGTNTYTGGTTINAGLLRIGNGNTNGSAGLGTGPVVNNGTLEFNLAGTNTFTNVISGSGILNLANANLRLNLAANNSAFTGDINVNVGSLWITNGSALGTGPKIVNVVGGGNSLFTQIHLNGIFGNINPDSSITYRLSQGTGVLINDAGSNTISGTILMPNGGGNPYIVVSNASFLTLAGPITTVTGNNPRTLTLGGAGNGLLSGVVSDTGLPVASLLKVDSGTWTISSINDSVAGTASVTNGTLVLNGVWGSPVTVAGSGGTLTGSGVAGSLNVNAGGNFVPGGYGSVGSFTVSNILTMAASGTSYFSINKALSPAQSNTVVNVISTSGTNVTASAGSVLVVSNLTGAPVLVGGDKFYLFNQAVTNGNLMTLTLPTLSSGLLWTNNLAVDGSIAVVASVNTNPTNIIAAVTGGQLILSWPADHTGWHLQAQTNSLATGLGTNWVTIPGTDASNSFTNNINNSNGSVFYRLTYP